MTIKGLLHQVLQVFLIALHAKLYQNLYLYLKIPLALPCQTQEPNIFGE